MLVLILFACRAAAQMPATCVECGSIVYNRRWCVQEGGSFCYDAGTDPFACVAGDSRDPRTDGCCEYLGLYSDRDYSFCVYHLENYETCEWCFAPTYAPNIGPTTCMPKGQCVPPDVPPHASAPTRIGDAPPAEEEVVEDAPDAAYWGVFAGAAAAMAVVGAAGMLVILLRK